MGKTVYIVPGFTESVHGQAYGQITEWFEKKGFDCILFQPQWRYRTMSDYLQQFEDCFQRSEDKVYFFGFSFGAMISFLSAPNLKPDMLILCSLSPFFKEDLPHQKKWVKRIMGEKRLKDFTHYSFFEYVRRISCKTLLISGKKESPLVLHRVREAYTHLSKSELRLGDMKHDIRDTLYLNEIKRSIEKL